MGLYTLFGNGFWTEYEMRGGAWMRVRLAILVALVFSISGALVPGYSTHLQKDLGFSPLELSFCAATQGIASLGAPLFGQIADRILAPSLLMALSALGIFGAIGGLILSTSPIWVFVFTLLYWLLTIPTWVLATTMLFSHLDNPERDFGRTRMWGTIGWIAAGWSLVPLMSLGWVDQGKTIPFFCLAMVLAAIMGAFACTMPWVKPDHPPGRAFAPGAALKCLWSKPFFLYGICVFGICVSQPFSVQGTPLLLTELGLPRTWLLPSLTLAQLPEAALSFILPGILLRVGIKGSMRIGLIAWCVALSILSLSRSLWPALASLPLNGMVITLFLIVGSIWLNSRIPADLRTSAQAIVVFIQGLGMCLGHLSMGILRGSMDLASEAEELRLCFLVGAILNGALAALFWWGFNPLRTQGHSFPQTSSRTPSAT